MDSSPVTNSQLSDGAGAAAASYRYAAFGTTRRATGSLAQQNPYRFSTKPVDGTGLYYYGYRYYHPGMGRWVSRDPESESGFGSVHMPLKLNVGRVHTEPFRLYDFAVNRPVDVTDFLGLSISDDLGSVCSIVESADFAQCMGIRRGLVAGLKAKCRKQKEVPIFLIDDPVACQNVCGFTVHPGTPEADKRTPGIYICDGKGDECPRACTVLHELTHWTSRDSGDAAAYDTECCVEGCKAKISKEWQNKGNCQNPSPICKLPKRVPPN